MPKLIVLEGSDGVGKSTLAKDLYEKMGSLYTRTMRQPASDSPLGFLRDVSKFDPSFGPFERQLLIACSHVWDAATFDQSRDVVMDRCWISGMVYGGLGGVSKENLHLLAKIYQSVYLRALKHYQVLIVHVNPGRTFRVPEAGDVFEKHSPERMSYAYSQVLYGGLGPFMSETETYLELTELDPVKRVEAVFKAADYQPL
jgi:deoxyadenosine/deoxycytidine kinase